MYLYRAALLAYGLVQIAVGIIFIVQREKLMLPLTIIGGSVLILHGFMNIINYITKQGHVSKRRLKSFLFMGVISIILGIVALAVPKSTFRIVTLVFALYILLNGASKLADFIVMKINRQPGGWTLFIAFVCSVFGFLMF